MKRLCVFCGSSAGADPAYVAGARALGRALVADGVGLVYGGAHLGLMGVLADTVLAAGGEVIGVIPRAMMDREIGHTGLTTLHIVETMHQRKAKMADLADGFIALPGGMGTLEEFCEILTWAQLGVHDRPCGLLDIDGYYTPFLHMLDHMVARGFMPPAERGRVLVASEPEGLLALFATYQAPAVKQWLDRARI